MRYFSALLVLALFSCSSIQESSEQVMGNAQSVYKRGHEKMWVAPAGSVGTPMEAGAGHVLENAASVVRSASDVMWIPVEEVEELERTQGAPAAAKADQGPSNQLQGEQGTARAQMKPSHEVDSAPQNIYTRDITPEVKY